MPKYRVEFVEYNRGIYWNEWVDELTTSEIFTLLARIFKDTPVPAYYNRIGKVCGYIIKNENEPKELYINFGPNFDVAALLKCV